MPRVNEMHLLKLSIIAGLAGVLLIGLIGCSSDTSDRALIFIDPPQAEELMGSRKLLGLGGSRAGVWVDPRQLTAYVEGHIPGAVHLPFQDVSTEHTMLEGYDFIVVYGDGYNDTLSLAMSKRLISLGYSDVRTLRGGLRAWTADGNALETGPPKMEPPQ